jgi:K(+)-stimulated pyrophosphate-energized sodium pump
MPNLPLIWFIAPFGAVSALIFAYYFFVKVRQQDAGNARMQEIAGYVREGAFAYLMQQYKGVIIFFAVAELIFLVLAYGLKVLDPMIPWGFLSGGFMSGLAGFIGMNTATMASSRTAQACSESLDKGLKVAFRAGGVMGLTVVGLALLDMSIWFFVLNAIGYSLEKIAVVMLSFGMGASTQALFARLGGGIYTKAAADVVLIWWARWKLIFRKTIPAIQPPSQITWEITWEMWQGWAQTSTKATQDPSWPQPPWG